MTNAPITILIQSWTSHKYLKIHYVSWGGRRPCGAGSSSLVALERGWVNKTFYGDELNADFFLADRIIANGQVELLLGNVTAVARAPTRRISRRAYRP